MRADRVEHPPARALPLGRRVSVRVLLVPGLLLAGLLMSAVLADVFGLAGSPVGSAGDPPPSPAALAGAATPGEAVHLAAAAVASAALLVGGVGLLLRPGGPGRAALVLGVGAAVLPAAVIVGDPDNVGGQAGPVDPVFLALPLLYILAGVVAGPWRRGPAPGPRAVLLGFAVAAVGPAVWFGVGQALVQRTTFPPTADPHHNAHWFVVAAVGFMVVVPVLTAVLVGCGWRLAAVTSAAAAGALGGASLVAPAAASATGGWWSLVALAWGAGLVAVVVRAGAGGRFQQAPAGPGRRTSPPG